MKNIIAVVSGKGGVGKSTVATSLAISLADAGHKVALIDSDFYGPSIPTLMGGGQIQLDHENKILPPQKHGVKYMSIGFFLKDPDDAVVWRGPMFNTAMKQLFNDVSWGEVDYCVVDMPPGTGDAQISLAQNYSLAGALVVTTPQEVALADVRKSINMLAQVNVPLLGVIENMAGFITPDGTKHEIFGSGGGAQVAQMFKAPLLASIPIEMKIREGGDKGEPFATQSGPIKDLFVKVAKDIEQSVPKAGTNTASAVNIVN